MNILVCRYQPQMRKFIKKCIEKAPERAGVIIAKQIENDEKMQLLHLLEQQSYGVVLLELDLRTEGEYIHKLSSSFWPSAKENSEYLMWSFNREKIILNVDEIYYIQSYLRKTSVHTYSEKYRINSTVSREAERLADKGFIRVHQGYLVRTVQIRSVQTQSLVLKNGDTIPVSNRYKKAVCRQTEEFERG